MKHKFSKIIVLAILILIISGFAFVKKADAVCYQEQDPFSAGCFGVTWSPQPGPWNNTSAGQEFTATPKYQVANMSYGLDPETCSASASYGQTCTVQFSYNGYSSAAFTSPINKFDALPPVCGTTWTNNGGGSYTLSGPTDASADSVSGMSLLKSTNNYTCTASGGPCNVTIYDNAGNTRTCTSPTMSGTLTPSSSSCTINAGLSTCPVTLTWTTTNPVATSAVTNNGGATPNPGNSVNNGSQSFNVQISGFDGVGNTIPTTFYLYNNAVKLAQSSATATCTSGTAWYGGVCAIPTHIITPSAGTGGSISPNTPQTVTYRSRGSFTITPNTGYSLSTPVGGTCGGYMSGNTYTTETISQNCTVIATFTSTSTTATIQGLKVRTDGGDTAPVVNQTVSVSGGPSSSANSYSLTVNAGATYTVSVTSPGAGWTIGSSLCIDSTSCHGSTNGSGASRSVTMPAGSGHFADLWWHFTPPAVVNGVCSATHYGCSAGTSANNVSGASAWTWNCNSSNGGTNASCSENKPAPDLTAGAVTPTTVAVNTSTTFSSTITNIGDASTGSSFSNFFQLKNSGGTIIDLPPTAMSKLDAGTTNQAKQSYIFSLANTFLVRTCADKTSSAGGGVIAESNEANNCGPWTDVTVTGSIPPSCTNISASDCGISGGESTCDTILNWGTQNLTSGDTAVTRNNPDSHIAPPILPTTSGTNVRNTVRYGIDGRTTFFLYHNIDGISTKLCQATMTASCNSGSIWDGSTCKLIPDGLSGTLTPEKPSCDIPQDKSSCPIKFTWNTIGAVEGGTISGVRSDVNDFGNPWSDFHVSDPDANSDSKDFVIPYNTRTFYLYNTNQLAESTVTSKCISGTAWNGVEGAAWNVNNKCVKIPPLCGNSKIEGSETCDNGPGNDTCPNTCSALCTTNSCGGGGNPGGGGPGDPGGGTPGCPFGSIDCGGGTPGCPVGSTNCNGGTLDCPVGRTNCGSGTPQCPVGSPPSCSQKIPIYREN